MKRPRLHNLALPLVLFLHLLCSHGRQVAARIAAEDYDGDSHDEDETPRPPSQYMYEDEYEPYVTDYHIEPFETNEDRRDAVMAYLAGADADGHAARLADYEHTKNTPPFLNSTGVGPRVVEFYTPWCPHCQEYKHQFVDLARTVQSMPVGAEVKFFAISCTAHRPICKNLGIRRYPAVLGFKAGSAKGEQWPRNQINPEYVLKQLGLVKQHRDDALDVNKGRSNSKISDKTNPSTPLSSQQQVEVSTTSHRANMVRQKKDVFSDAFLSFEFNLRNEVYMDDGPLSPEQRMALRRWINLLFKTIPVTNHRWHTMLRTLRSEFEEIVDDEDVLYDVVTDEAHRPLTKHWSDWCSNGRIGGYTCGLWELIHIATIGVVEWNGSENVSPAARIDLADAAEIIRTFVEHFFGCEVCKDHFLELFDDCTALDRCARLSRDGDSNELALYFWQFHNAVNVRLQKEKAERFGRPLPNEKKQREVLWPDKDLCPDCWNSNVSGSEWNKDAVYKFLQSQYWAEDIFVDVGGSQSADGSSSPGDKQQQDKEPTLMDADLLFLSRGTLISSNVFSFIIVPIGAVGLYSLFLKWEKDRLGKMKKFDNACSRGGGGNVVSPPMGRFRTRSTDGGGFPSYRR